MNEIIKKALLVQDKFMPEIHLRQLDLCIVLVNCFLKTKRECKNLKKQEIQDIFIKTN